MTEEAKKQEITLEFIEQEISEFTKKVQDRVEYILHLEKEIEQANCDRNAFYGALQQSIKIKTMLSPIGSNIIPLKKEQPDVK